MTDVKEDIRQLERYFLNRSIYPSIKNNTTFGFESEDMIYPYTNEQLNKIFNIDLTNKKCLVVTSSGDHIIHAILNGSSDVTSFDINRFCKYYAELKMAAIKTYEYEQFTINIEKFVNSCNMHFLNLNDISQILDDIKDNMSVEVLEFWNNFYKLIPKMIYKPRFFYDEDLKGILSESAYYDEDTYCNLKNKLLSVKVKYIDSDILKLNNINEKYDYINISNILDYTEDDNLILKVIYMLEKLLKENGTLDASITGFFGEYSYYKKMTNLYIKPLFGVIQINDSIGDGVRLIKR